MINLQLPSPLTQISHPVLHQAQVSLWIKRDDLIHPQISGNKWRKLQGYIAMYLQEHQLPNKHIISFGGAYSNHLHALALVCQQAKIKLTAIVRGEVENQDNITLSACKALGAELIFVDRQTYKRRHQTEYLQDLQQEYPDSHIIPEGGFGQAGMLGLTEMLAEIKRDFDYVCCPVGSGTTAAGIADCLALPASIAKQPQTVLGFCAIKNGAYLADEIAKLRQYPSENIHLFTDYHFGGFAKISPELLNFIADFYQSQQLLLDPIYTGKAMFGLFDLLKQGKIPQGSRIIFVHTGGLQGWQGMLERGLITPNYAHQLGIVPKK